MISGYFSFGGFFLHRPESGCRDSYLFSRTIFESDSDGTEIGKLTLLCLVVCMRYIVSYERPFSGYLTFSSHDSYLFVI